MRIHGGDYETFKIEYGRMPLDFSASVSPLGMPLSARMAAADSLADCDRYPDPECRALRKAIGEHAGIQADRILCGSGASDLIDRLIAALRPSHALITAPTYGEYSLSLTRSGCDILEYQLYQQNGFLVGEDILTYIDDSLDLLILCEPNNPTGRTTDRSLLERIAMRCDLTGTLLVLDECFNDFLDDPEGHSLMNELDSHHLLILRAFTKFYGMAGLRLGWCASRDTELLAKMKAAGQPWPVSTPATAAALAAMEDKGYQEKLRMLIRVQRCVMKSALEAQGVQVIPGEANYLLFFSQEKDLKERLARQGILIRDCSSFAGLGEGWYRIAIRTESENRQLIDALRSICR
ncbi:MAG: pyridoxal phosphate-dependent class II aminotransferase [Blautia sp.]|nr:pyridoxal phosphate-dependent class II aminotransferase [Blautia sp.]